ncbi:MAG TPA: hypothetical protein DCY20_01895 [Firmicutes bacterium]|nr:hypothetical protein [Bacillota bacterium]
MNTKFLVLGALLTVIATIFQCIPALLSEAFIFFTIFSTFPIFLAARLKTSLGIICYLLTILLISFISPHESLIFIFTNGVVGLSLGVARFYFNATKLIFLLSGLILFLSLNLVPYITGVLLFGFSLQLNLVTQVPLLIFCLVYCLIFQYLCDIIYKRVLPVIPKA